MLTDPTEIEIISHARQKNVRDPKRSRAHFEHIFEAFLTDIDFKDCTCLDLGPGQFDFGVMVRERGGDVIGIDNDPAVIALGHHKQFECHDADLRNLADINLPERFDGIFCKFSISAFWFDTAQQNTLVKTLRAMLKPEGWLWIAPWNGVSEDMPDGQAEAILRQQISSFRNAGFEAWELSDVAVRHFGVHGTVANNVLFTDRVNMPTQPGLLRLVSADKPFGTAAPWPDIRPANLSRSTAAPHGERTTRRSGSARLRAWLRGWLKGS